MINKGNLLVLILVILTVESCSIKKNIIYKEENLIPDLLNSKNYTLVWNDEFNISGKPDTSKWTYDIGCNGWGNNELQNYTSDEKNVRVVNGNLIIEAIKSIDSTCAYTSARIKTKNKGNWLFGRVEVKAKIPKGRGTWPAIWMLPTGNKYGKWPSSGEIDIMEHVGYQPDIIHGTAHTESFNHTQKTQVGKELFVSTATSEFHIYAIEWDEQKIDFYIDDNKYFTFFNQNKSYREWPFDKKFYIILNLAIGGNLGGVKGVDESMFPVRFIIDYVRVYQHIK